MLTNLPLLASYDILEGAFGFPIPPGLTVQASATTPGVTYGKLNTKSPFESFAISAFAQCSLYARGLVSTANSNTNNDLGTLDV